MIPAVSSVLGKGGDQKNPRRVGDRAGDVSVQLETPAKRLSGRGRSCGGNVVPCFFVLMCGVPLPWGCHASANYLLEASLFERLDNADCPSGSHSNLDCRLRNLSLVPPAPERHFTDSPTLR
jgi:hypothetical protein